MFHGIFVTLCSYHVREVSHHLPHSLSGCHFPLISLLSSSEFEELDLEDEEVQEAGEEEEEPSQAEPPCSSDSLSPLLKTALTEVDRAIAIVTGRHGKQHPKYAQYSGGPTSILASLCPLILCSCTLSCARHVTRSLPISVACFLSPLSNNDARFVSFGHFLCLSFLHSIFSLSSFTAGFLSSAAPPAMSGVSYYLCLRHTHSLSLTHYVLSDPSCCRVRAVEKAKILIGAGQLSQAEVLLRSDLENHRTHWFAHAPRPNSKYCKGLLAFLLCDRLLCFACREGVDLARALYGAKHAELAEGGLVRR